MTDRIVGLVLFALSIGYGVIAYGFEASFGDPLGPSAFPMIIAVPAAMISLALVLKPGPDAVWPAGRPLMMQGAALAVLIGYALLLEPLGFPLATALGVTLLARLIGAGWIQGLAAGAGLAGFLYYLFDRLLDLPLPALPQFAG